MSFLKEFWYGSVFQRRKREPNKYYANCAYEVPKEKRGGRVLPALRFLASN
jgi:hypothetical protein